MEVSRPNSTLAGSPIEPLAYRVRQVAVLLNLPVRTVYDMVRRRVIDSVRIGAGRRRLTLIPAEAVDKLLAEYRVSAVSRPSRLAK